MERGNRKRIDKIVATSSLSKPDTQKVSAGGRCCAERAAAALATLLISLWLPKRHHVRVHCCSPFNVRLELLAVVLDLVAAANCGVPAPSVVSLALCKPARPRQTCSRTAPLV